MSDKIEILRAKLNEMILDDDAVLHAGEILELSQKLDKLVFVKQNIMIRRTQTNYNKQLQSFLSPKLYIKVVAVC